MKPSDLAIASTVVEARPPLRSTTAFLATYDSILRDCNEPRRECGASLTPARAGRLSGGGSSPLLALDVSSPASPAGGHELLLFVVSESLDSPSVLAQ